MRNVHFHGDGFFAEVEGVRQHCCQALKFRPTYTRLLEATTSHRLSPWPVTSAMNCIPHAQINLYGSDIGFHLEDRSYIRRGLPPRIKTQSLLNRRWSLAWLKAAPKL